MCQSLAEGGRRCRIRAHLESLTLDDLRPKECEDRPRVEWDGEAEPADLWDSHPSPIACEAVAQVAEARDDEEQITTDLIAVSPGLHGLEFRLKSPSSTARKISTRVKRLSGRRSAKNKSREVADAMTDILRYTALSPAHSQIVPTARSMVAGMTEHGYEVVEAEHSYVAGNPYKGLHLLLRSPTGRTVEVQVHSAESQQVKDQLHVDYEIERDAGQPLPERVAARQRMEDLAATVPTPPGLEELRELGGVEVAEKSYSNPYRNL